MTTLTMEPAAIRNPSLAAMAECPSGAADSSARADTETLVAAHALAVRVARRLLDGDAREGIDAEDVAQEVLLRFAQLDVTDLDNWEAWVTRAARNRAIDLMRAMQRHRNVEFDRFSDEAGSADGRGRPTSEPLPIALIMLGPSAQAMHHQLVEHATQVLTDTERGILFRHLAGWTNTEIANELGYAGANVIAVTLSRARRKVRQAIPAGMQRDLLLGDQRLY